MADSDAALANYRAAHEEADPLYTQKRVLKDSLDQLAIVRANPNSSHAMICSHVSLVEAAAVQAKDSETYDKAVDLAKYLNCVGS